ncbi:hypothetical protein GZL_04584 [Streptomyces sp. 769]|nr:hypothetical protein GZL_04584 [Streptomyces sp. 769]
MLLDGTAAPDRWTRRAPGLGTDAMPGPGGVPPVHDASLTFCGPDLTR